MLFKIKEVDKKTYEEQPRDFMPVKQRLGCRPIPYPRPDRSRISHERKSTDGSPRLWRP